VAESLGIEPSRLLRLTALAVVVRNNSIQSSCSHLFQPILVVQSAEHGLPSKNVSRRKAMTMAAHRRRWSDRVGNAWTKTAVNSRVIVIGDPLRQEAFQMPLPKWDQEIQALPSDRPHQPLTEGIRFGRPHRRL
jgi:hypothetical protein